MPLIDFGSNCTDDCVAEVVVQNLLTTHVQLAEVLEFGIDVGLFELSEGLVGL